MDAEAAALVAALGLEPLPLEGGWFRQTWRSARTVDGRPVGTAIVTLWTPTDFSAMHRLGTDEVWHFYRGDAFVLLLLHPDSTCERRVLGPGGDVQAAVAAGVWMGGHVVDGGSHALMGATMAPGWDPSDFEVGIRDDLVAAYPAAAEEIGRLTRE